MVLENVDRIALPSPELFFERYVKRGVPAILKGVFDSAPLRAIDSAELAEQRLCGVSIEVQPNYMTFLETGRRGERRSVDLGAFLERLRHSGERELCVEYRTPEKLLELLPLPALAQQRAPDDVVSATFVAGAGNFNHLHYDDDQRDVLLYQVFGRKRFILISAADSRKLDAFVAVRPETRRALASVPARDANGRVFFEHMS
jgi:hypothetical protein